MALNNGQHKYSTVYGRQIDLDPEKRKEWIQRERERARARERAKYRKMMTNNNTVCYIK